VELVIIITLSVITVFNTVYIYLNILRQKEIQNTLNKIVENFFEYQSAVELNRKLMLDYITKLERHVALLAFIPSNPTMH
jgi:hypothetical protein